MKIAPRPETGDGFASSFAKIPFEHLLEMGEADPPVAQRIAILIFLQVGVAAKNVRRLFHGLAKR